MVKVNTTWPKERESGTKKRVKKDGRTFFFFLLPNSVSHHNSHLTACVCVCGGGRSSCGWTMTNNAAHWWISHHSSPLCHIGPLQIALSVRSTPKLDLHRSTTKLSLYRSTTDFFKLGGPRGGAARHAALTLSKHLLLKTKTKIGNSKTKHKIQGNILILLHFNQAIVLLWSSQSQTHTMI